MWKVGDFSTVGAFSAVHQFCRVGEHAFIGGDSMCTQDVLPFVKTVGSRPTKTYGINSIGLQRKGFSPETIEALQRAYRILTALEAEARRCAGEDRDGPRPLSGGAVLRGVHPRRQAGHHPMTSRVRRLPGERTRSLRVQCGGRRPRRPTLCRAESDGLHGPGPARAPASTLNLLPRLLRGSFLLRRRSGHEQIGGDQVMTRVGVVGTGYPRCACTRASSRRSPLRR